MMTGRTLPLSLRRGVVVAVSGTSGAGKSTLIDQATCRLGSVTRLHFDDYLVLGNDIREITAWLQAGGDPDWIKTPRLAADLRRLIAGHTVDRPGHAASLHPAAVIILEEPFGRARQEIAPLIDLAVHLEVPPEVALGRRILRAIQARSAGSDADATLIAEMEGQLQAYLAVGRQAYFAAERAAGGAADLVLDGLRPADALVEQLLAEIEARR